MNQYNLIQGDKGFKFPISTNSILHILIGHAIVK